MKSLFGSCTGNLFGSQTEMPQCLIVGLDNAGKTTLLYRLKMGNSWKKDAMKKDLANMKEEKEDPKDMDTGYHYEEINMFRTCGMWEVPGNQAMRHVWRAFYASIKIHCVIWVIDAAETAERIATAKKLLHLL
jgi:GTPase SAR1 family protein